MTTTRERDDTQPFGPDATQILATEHWSLLSSRALIWNEAINRTTLFLGPLSASIIALALMADATGFGTSAITLAMVLLPVVLFLGIATHIRLVRINSEEVKTLLAMNRLRHAYLEIAPGIEPYITTGHHDDGQGLAASYLLAGAGELRPLAQYFQATATIVATVDAALAAAIVVLAALAADAPIAVLIAVGSVVFLIAWGALFSFQRHALDPLRRMTPRFPTPTPET